MEAYAFFIYPYNDRLCLLLLLGKVRITYFITGLYLIWRIPKLFVRRVFFLGKFLLLKVLYFTR